MVTDEAVKRRGFVRALGLGLITGAADDDPSAIGTYASSGAKLGPAFLWMAPLTFPMMVTVVYLSSKLGLASGEGLFAVIRRHYSRTFLWTVLIGVLIGDIVEAGADLGGMAAALNLLLPVPIPVAVVTIALIILALQIWGSYETIRNIFRLLSLALLAYIGSAVLARPEIGPVLRGTLLPTIRFDKEFLAIVVAVIGSSLSAYIFAWQSNEEVEEKIAAGQRRIEERKGTTRAELRRSLWDVGIGMFFSNCVMYFIMLSTASTLFKAGHRDINFAADAAQALRPLAGNAAGLLFAAGMFGVGFLSVPVMTVGAAYNLCQSVGWKHGLYRKPHEAKGFYRAIVVFTLLAAGLNFLGINPMKALVVAGVVQGISTPPLLLLVMRMTNNTAIVGKRVNGPAINALGWTTTAVTFSAIVGLLFVLVTNN